MPSRLLRHPRPARLTAFTAVTALAAAAVVSLASPAQAAAGAFTQASPIVGTHSSDDYMWDINSTVTPIPDGGSATTTVVLDEAPANATVTWVYAYVDLSHASLDDVDLVLTAPNGRAMTLQSDAGGANAYDDWLNFYTDDAPMPDESVTGDYWRGPVDYDTTPGDADAFPAVAPADFGALGGSSANGTWTLHAYDDTAGNVGQIDAFEVDVYYGLPADPSPSSLPVSGLPSGTTDVNLVLNDLTGYFGYTELVLQSPDGRRAHVLSDALDDDDMTGQDIGLDDEAASSVPRYSTAMSGTYRPRNYDNGDQNEVVGGVETIEMSAALSVFDGGNPNGTWKLFAHQEYSSTDIVIGSWSLQISTVDGPAAPAVGAPRTGARVTDDTVTLSGTAVDGAVVRATEGGRTQSTVADGGQWSITRSGLTEGSHTFSVTQTVGGNVSPAAVVTVVVDTVAPKARKTKPKDGAKGVTTSVSPTVTFSEAMNARSLKKNVKLTTASGKKVKAAYKWNARKKTLTLNPKKNLVGGSEYVLVVKKGARDVAGNKLAKGRSVDFTTA
jgi:subtilisin-like proprotein convertase family protein